MLIKRLLLLNFISLLAINVFGKDRVEIAAENAPAVVAINVLKKDGSLFTGTGFVITSDGLIVTSLHTLQDAASLNITFPDGVVSGKATPIVTSQKVDLALLQIAARDLHTVQLADSQYVQPGQEITVIGNPRRLQNTVSSGIISQVRKKEDGIIWHQISAPISPSSSGSPVFNEDGKVISVAFASYPGENNQNLNFAIPSNYVIQLLEENDLPIPFSYWQDPSQKSLWEKCKHHLQLSWKSFCSLFSSKN